jgi:hypothetical protein
MALRGRRTRSISTASEGHRTALCSALSGRGILRFPEPGAALRFAPGWYVLAPLGRRYQHAWDLADSKVATSRLVSRAGVRTSFPSVCFIGRRNLCPAGAETYLPGARQCESCERWRRPGSMSIESGNPARAKQGLTVGSIVVSSVRASADHGTLPQEHPKEAISL